MFLSAYYDLSIVKVCATELGARCRRARQFIVLTLRTVVHLTRPLADMTPMFRRTTSESFTWRDYLVASEAELAAELRWGKARKGGAVAHDPRATFEHCLLDSELERLHIFKDKHNISHTVANLSQDPEYCRAAGRDLELQTLVPCSH